MNGNSNPSQASATGSNVAANPSQSQTPSDVEPEPYRVFVSTRFMVLTLSACSLLAFAVGRAARILLLEGSSAFKFNPHDSSLYDRPDYHLGSEARRQHLPPPLAINGKPVPRTIYTSKNFDTAKTATSSSLLIRRSEDDEQCLKDGTCIAPEDVTLDNIGDEEYLPAGQHLLVDIDGLEAAFLNSEERLAHAMVSVVQDANLTLLSYHCHKMVPTGVSCVGVLLESHISFHTWPAAGVITLDLFTCGSNPLLPVVPSIERLFGIPRDPEVEPVVVWSHKLRGFRPKGSSPLQLFDLGIGTLGMMGMKYKKKIISVQTPFQQIDIYDIIQTRFNSIHNYKKSLSDDGSYHSRHPEFFRPDRLVFLDGVMQSRSTGEHAYHEALVHPALFAHPHPKRAAIIGGGEGATLREVLKHNTIEKAVMIDIDEQMVALSRKYLPEWNDCSDLVGSAKWCGDDERAEVLYEDGLAYFIDRYGTDEGGDEQGDNELFDVVIIDALDPQDEVEFCDALYNNGKFLKSLYLALSETGALVIQVGPSPGLDDPPELMGLHRNRAILIQHLTDLGFESLHIYGDGHSGLTDIWNYLIAFKSHSLRRDWFRNEAEIDLDIRKRIKRTHSGEIPLFHFDGATMVSYQFPSRVFQTAYCKSEPTPSACGDLGFDPKLPITKVDMLTVKKSTAGEQAGRGLFATTSIPGGSYVGSDSSSHAVHFPPLTFDLIDAFASSEADDLEVLLYYIHGYGFQVRLRGAREVYVDSSILTFMNHGCDGTYNVGDDYRNISESTVSIDAMPEHLSIHEPFNPAKERHLRYHVLVDQALRDVQSGEEITSNYLEYIGDIRDWEHDVKHLQSQCSGEGLGDVSEYETY